MESQNGSDRMMSLFESVTAANPRSLPQPPPEYIEFHALPKTKQFELRDKFNANEAVKTYIDQKWNTELHNRDSFLWLWDVYENEKDTSKRRALEIKMAQIKKVIQSNLKPFPALTLDFGRYMFEPMKQTQKDWVE